MPSSRPHAAPASRHAVAVRHVHFEDLGVLAPLLERRGYRVSYVEAPSDPLPVGSLDDADLVVVLGGPVGIGDAPGYPFLSREIAAVQARLATGRPTLGVCLGAQVLAAALAADVAPTGRTEIGYAPLDLTDDGQRSVLAPLAGVPVLHWHGDAFAIPQGARRLAATPGFPNQAFSHGRSTLGLQFHVEANPARIEQWLVGHAHELAGAGIDPRALREDARRHGAALTAAATAVLTSWLDEVEDDR
ncbi:glutamine amidotransferase [Cellulosimicrobium sp. SL-1]|uniref:glutamine amidotransferase n=1 Tax=Cellulosimicrobium sp. SL-1 TaxID=2699423 RepID=UPI0013D296FA|nr:glutamine amidotransferase [Cellulosimicrobium sp. SL-1]